MSHSFFSLLASLPKLAIRPRLAPALYLAVLGVVGLVSLACEPPSGPPTTVPDNARAQDANTLPGFANPPPASTDIERFFVELGDAPILGPANADITIVMFSDFECPYCAQGHTTLQQLRSKYPAQVRLVYKAYPLDFHSSALLAAMVARSAQAQDKFWAFHDLLFSGARLEPDRIFGYAKQVGMDMPRLMTDLNTLEYAAEVRGDLRQARRLGVSSTPTFFLNGRQVSGAKPLEEFEVLVKEELEFTAALKASGVRPEQIYARTIEDGYRRVKYTKTRGLDPDGVFAVPLGGSPSKGPADAPVTIVAFSDFECPFCARGNDSIAELEQLYGDRLRIVYKNNPLPMHGFAFVAARAAMAAYAQGKFWAYHDALYDLRAQFGADDLKAIAKRIGLKMKPFEAALANATFDPAIEADLGLAMALGVTGTPAYFINGRPVEGALPVFQFRMLIEEELDRAKAALARGVAPADLYETLSHQPLP